MTVGHIRCGARMVSRCAPDRQPTAADDRRWWQQARRAASHRGGIVGALWRQPPTRCGAPWKTCRATGWCGWSRARQFRGEDVLDYAVEARTRFSEWIRKHNKEPSGQVLQLREMPADQRVAAGLGMRAGAGSCCWNAWASPMNGRSAWLVTISPAVRLKGMLEALRTTPRITEALRAVGVDDYLRQQTRVTARLPTQGRG